MITLITGGVKSGKSAYAIELFQRYKKGAFIATTDPDDDSMKEKIINHQEERKGLNLETIEIPLDLASGLDQLNSGYEVVIIDCVTMWLANLMYKIEFEKRAGYISNFFNKLKAFETDCIIITNEVGLGVIPENKLAREYASELGKLNRQLALTAQKVVLMVSGIPVIIK